MIVVSSRTSDLSPCQRLIKKYNEKDQVKDKRPKYGTARYFCPKCGYRHWYWSKIGTKHKLEAEFCECCGGPMK